MSARRRRTLAAVLLAASSLLAGCGRSSGHPASASVPIRVIQPTTTQAATLLVDVSVGGGPPVPVVLDTGSSGLVIARSAVGPKLKPIGRQATKQYVGFTVTSDLDQATVALTGATPAVTTPAVTVAVTGASAPFLRQDGAMGILGIAPGGDGADPQTPLSPLLSLPGQLAQGYTVAATGSSPALQLGIPTTPAGGATLPLTQADFHYPGGHQAYERPVTLCWTVAEAHQCAATTLDTGAPGGIVDSGTFPSAPVDGQRVALGTTMSFADPSGTWRCSFTVGTSTRAPDYEPSAVMNTGIRLFLATTVGFDLRAGQVVVGPIPGACP